MIFKRIVSAITCSAVLASSLSVFSGCSMKEFFDNSPKESAAESGVITNGDWLKMVNDAFGMQVDENAEDGEIEAAKAWGVIGENEEIDKNAPVDDKFVASTLTKAAGFADRNATDEEIAQAAVEHHIISSTDASVSKPEEAVVALAQAQQDWAHPTLEEHLNVDLADNVQNFNDIINVNDIKISSDSVNLPTTYASSLERDSVFIVPKDEGGQGGAYKVVSTIENSDGTTSVKCVPASVEEVYKKLDISGTFSANLDSFEPDEGVKVVAKKAGSDEGMIKPLGFAGDEPKIQQLDSVSVSNNEFEIEKSFGEFDVVASISDVKLNTDVDWDFGFFSGLDVNRIFMTVDYKTKVGVKCGWEGSTDPKEFDLGKYFIDEPSIKLGKVSVYICPGISVNLKVSLTLEASGELSVSIVTENSKGFELKNGKLRTINETQKEAEIALSGEVGAYATLTLALSLDYIVDEVDLLSLNLKVGPTLKASATLHDREGTDKDLLCFDISGYMKIEVTLNLLETILDLFDFEATIKLFECDETNSPIKWNGIHIENFQKVDHCTADEEATTTTTAPATVAVGIFELDTAYLSLTEGGSGTISVKSLPSGYSLSDLEWTSSDPSKVTVDNNGNVKAVASGSAGITVTTKDGKNSASCVVNVVKKISFVNTYESDEDTEIVAIAA